MLDRVRNVPRVGVFAFAFIVIVVLATVVAGWIAPYDPAKQNLVARFLPPFSDGHILGTDSFGRDVLSRLLVGGRLSIGIGMGGSLAGGFVGTILGIVAGVSHRAGDLFVNRVFDVLLAFPAVLMVLAIIASLGPSVPNIIAAIGVAVTPIYGRVARSAALGVSGQEYIGVAMSLGAGRISILGRHVLPNIVSSVLVVGTVTSATCILLEATLSFLGVGVPPPAASWGTIISDGAGFMNRAPWISISGGVAVFLFVLALTVSGDALRDLLDPRTKVSDAGKAAPSTSGEGELLYGSGGGRG